MEQKFSLIEDKVTKKATGVNLSFEDVISESWNLPLDFKMPKMAKFKSKGNPSIHAQHYLHLMAPLGLTKEKVALHFGHSLDGPAIEWYHSLTPRVKKDWDTLVKEFVKQYDYITKIQVTLADLEVVQQKSNESFNDYYLRWMQKANMVKQKPSESDMISRLIAGALPTYSDVMEFQNLLTFSDVNTVRLKVEKEL